MHDGNAETLWAFVLGRDRYQLDNIPFLAFDLSLNDVVSAPVADDIPTFERVLERSGHSTYRLALQDGVDPATFPELVGALKDLGCRLERFTPRMIGVDVPPSVDIHAAYEVISSGMTAGNWHFDEVNVEHSLT
jgi:hypothetical protein